MYVLADPPDSDVSGPIATHKQSKISLLVHTQPVTLCISCSTSIVHDEQR